jgi:tRNA threonylcarbamoyl adenosine modification protein YeaZ
MLILAIDCSASLCAACVWDGAAGVELGREVLDLGKGHAEHVVPVVEAALAGAGKAYGDLGRIAVSVGPGSFTGIRVAVSAARGYALALGIPAVGVDGLEALAAQTRAALGPCRVLVALASGETVQAAVYHELGDAVYAPAVMTLQEAAAMAEEHRAALAGTAAPAIARLVGAPPPLGPLSATADIAFFAERGALREPSAARPRPLYLREPDAKPQASFVLPRRDGD